MSEQVARELVVWLLVIPAAAAVLAALLGPGRVAWIRWVSLSAAVVDLILAAVLAVNFAEVRAAEARELPAGRAAAPLTFSPRFATRIDLLPVGTGPRPEAIQFYVGLDGLNVWLVLLTAVLMVPSVLISWTAVRERVPEYYAWLLALETALLGVFLSFDIILFYVFFELTLVPLFFLIGIWGGPERRYAARKFFIYTLTGSLITLLGVLGVVWACYNYIPETSPAGEANYRLTFAIPELVRLLNTHLGELRARPGDPEGALAFWRNVEFWAFMALAAGFAVKVPLVPLHTWLPLAHVEAPTAGSVLLAGVLLKLGTYGFLRLCLPLTPDASLAVGVPLIGTMAVIGIVYGAFCALAQDDIKKLVAYSSVSHLGFCMLGMFSLNQAGLAGSLLQMINHGLSTGALFLLVGMLYERYHTRALADYGGMGARLPLLACFMVFFCLSSIGLPGLNGFVGEVLVLMGMFSYESAHGQWPALAVAGSTGIVLGAWYLLTMLRRVFFGPVKEPAHAGHEPVADLDRRELAALLPVAVLCVALGVYPQPFLDTARPDLEVVAGLVRQAQAAQTAHATPTDPPGRSRPGMARVDQRRDVP
jgi:NADH-quinone oxidoreductase subunit M